MNAVSAGRWGNVPLPYDQPPEIHGDKASDSKLIKHELRGFEDWFDALNGIQLA
jgi:hypothetical protein